MGPAAKRDCRPFPCSWREGRRPGAMDDMDTMDDMDGTEAERVGRSPA